MRFRPAGGAAAHQQRSTDGSGWSDWIRRLAIIGAVIPVAAVAANTALAARTPTPSIPVSSASATVQVNDGLTPSGTSVKPFQVQLTIAGITFPNHEGGNHALAGNVFVEIALRVTNLASSPRLISFNGGNFKTMAVGASHNVPGLGVDDDACIPPALDGLGTNAQVANEVAAQWCVQSSTYESAVVRPHKSKVITFGGPVVSQTDAKTENFALIYSPSDAAIATILPVAPGGTATTVSS